MTSEKEIDRYRKQLLLFNDELLIAVKEELQGHIDYIDIELKRRNKKNG